MKRFFNSGKGSLKDKGDEFQELSLDILLAHKEDVNTKLKNEYKSFITRKLEIEKDLVEVEKHEILLREQEISEKKLVLDRKNEINKSNQDRVVEQLLILETKLEEHKAIHKQNEDNMDLEIKKMNQELDEVKALLNKKIEELGEDELSQDGEISSRLLNDCRSRANSGISRSSMFVEVGDFEAKTSIEDVNTDLSDNE